MYTPERRTEPPEPKVWGDCTLCGGDINYGEPYVATSLGAVCCDCADQFAYRRSIAGEEVPSWATL